MVIHVSNTTIEEQSSANRRSVDFTASGRSLVWHKNRSGPGNVPCGTPEAMVFDSDFFP